MPEIFYSGENAATCNFPRLPRIKGTAHNDNCTGTTLRSPARVRDREISIDFYSLSPENKQVTLQIHEIVSNLLNTVVADPKSIKPRWKMGLTWQARAHGASVYGPAILTSHDRACHMINGLDCFAELRTEPFFLSNYLTDFYN